MSEPRRCPTCARPEPASLEDTVRALIRDAIYEPYITQDELARRVGITPKHVSRTLHGHDGLSMDLAERMMAAVGRRFVVGVTPL